MSGRRARGSLVRTVFLGSGEFGIPSLRVLSDQPDVELVGVVTAPPRPVGRRQVMTPTPIESSARELGVPRILVPTRLRATDAIEAVLALRPELAVLADYGQLVPGAILALRSGALNLHPSLLPRHRGATPIQAAILAGDRTTGVTLFRMDEGLDSGPIVAAETVPLAGSETMPELEARLQAVAAALLARTLGPWLSGDLGARPQPQVGVTLTRPLRREDGRLDPTRRAEALERQMRALRPWPGTFLETLGERVAVLAASVAPSEPADTAGTIVPHGNGLALTTADGRLVLHEVQPAGGRQMAARDYRRGHPGVVGAAVASLKTGLLRAPSE